MTAAAPHTQHKTSAKPRGLGALFRPGVSHADHLLRSLVASFLGFTLDFTLLVLLRQAIPQTIAAAGSFVAGTFVVFLLNTFWVFTERRYRRYHIQLLVFFLLAVSGAALYTAIFSWLTSARAWHFGLAKLCASSLVFLYNFATRKFFLYMKRARPDHSR